MTANKIDESLQARAVVKSVRLETWRHFVGTMDGTQTTPEKKPSLRFKKHSPNLWGYDYNGVYKERDPAKAHPAGYTHSKNTHSRAQSCTVVDPSENFFPKTFAGLGLGDACVGIRFAAADPEMVYVKKVMDGDKGSVRGLYRGFSTKRNAKLEWKDKRSRGVLYPDLDTLVQAYKDDPEPPLNEVLARLRWQCKPEAQICIFTDNLNSRLLAQVRAKDLHRHLIAEAKKNNTPLPPEDYTVPISFYASGKKIAYYDLNEQMLDLNKDKGKDKPSKQYLEEQALRLFLQLSQGTTLFEKWDKKIARTHLSDLLGVASNLTLSTAYLFYQKIKPIIFTLDNRDPKLKNIDFWKKIFQCIPEEESITILHTLLNRFPTHHAALKSGFLQAEFDNYLQTGKAIPVQKKDLLSDILASNFYENSTYLGSISSFIGQKGHFDIVELIFQHPKITSVISPTDTKQMLDIYNHVSVSNQVASVIDRFVSSPYCHRKGLYRYTLLADIKEIFNSVEETPDKWQLLLDSYVAETNSSESLQNIIHGVGFFPMYQIIRAYSEHKIAIQNDISQKPKILKSFTQTYLRPYLQPEVGPISFKEDVFPAIRTMLIIMGVALAITAVITLSVACAPVTLVGCVLPMVALAEMSGILFGLFTTYMSFFACMIVNFDFTPQKKLISKLGLFSKRNENAGDKLVKAMNQDLQKTQPLKPKIAIMPQDDLVVPQEDRSLSP